jgi:phage head maturation protease
MPATQLTRREVPAAIRAAVLGGRSREAVLATDQPVEVFDARANRVILETLLLEGCEFKEPLPLLIDHDRRIPSQIGSVTSVRREPGRLIGTLRFGRNDAADQVWSLVTDGHARSVSVGYRILQETELRPGQSKAVSGRLFSAPADRPLRVVSKWTLKEVSLVVIPADPASGIRSFPSLSTFRSNQPMTVSTTIPTRNLDQMRLADLANLVLRSRGVDPPDNPADALEQAFPRRSAGVSGVDGAGELFGLVCQWVADGWRSTQDSLAGVYTIVPCDNFLEQQLVNVTTHPRMGRVPRGGVAREVGFGLASTGARLMRFGLKFSMSEEDLVDGEPLGAWRVGIEEAARAARALVDDLLWGCILSNPTLADGEPLFCASRGNVGTGAFSDENLRTAWGTIASQTDRADDGSPIHLNLQPRILITSPQGLIRAREFIRPQVVEGSEILPRSESRLSRTGFVDPVSGELLATPNDGAWLLGAPAEQRTSIALLLLRGETEPTVRQTPLRQGQWGMSFDIQFAAAAAALDGKGLFYSSADG